MYISKTICTFLVTGLIDTDIYEIVEPAGAFRFYIIQGTVNASADGLPVNAHVFGYNTAWQVYLRQLLLLVSCGSVLAGGHFIEYSMEHEVAVVSRPVAFILVVMFIGYIVFLILKARKNPSEDDKNGREPMWKCLLYIVIGLVLIIAGGQVVVNSAKEIARAAGMTETLIGLTIVAIGTSLPELVTSAVAARKGETGMAIGNVIGSNIFNLLFILGVSALIHPVAVNTASVYDLMILVVVSGISYIFAFTSRRIARGEGIFMLMIYAADVVFAILR